MNKVRYYLISRSQVVLFPIWQAMAKASIRNRLDPTPCRHKSANPFANSDLEVKSPFDTLKKKATLKIFEYGLIVWVNFCYLTNRLIGVVTESPSTRSRPTSLSNPQRLDYQVDPSRANREP